YLTAEHFADPLHGRLYYWLARLIDYGQVASATSIKAYIDVDRELQNIEVHRYLGWLLSVAKPVGEIDQLGHKIRDLYFRRHLMDLGDEIKREAIDLRGARNALDQIEAAQRRLTQLAYSSRTIGGFAPFRSAVADAISSTAASYLGLGQLEGMATGFVELDKL